MAELKLNELRRYAIDCRAEIKAADSLSDIRCSINTRGQASIIGQDRTARIEQVIDAADLFEVVAGGKSEALTREQMSAAMATHFKSRGFSSLAKDEDDH